MAKIKDIAGGFYDNDTIYSPNGYTQARRVSNAIVDRNISDMQNEIQQGENFGAEARKNKKEDDKSSISKKVVIGSPLPSKKEIAANSKTDKKAFSKSLKDSKDFAYKKAAELNTQADELEQEASNTEDEDEKRGLLKQAKSLRAEAERRRKDADITYNKNTKKETLVSPDSGHSGPTAEAADTSAPGTISNTNAVYGRKASDPAPKLELPTARPGLLEDKANAEKTLTEKRNERDDAIKTAKQDAKNTRRAFRNLSIIDDDVDFEDEFDGTNPAIAALFKKGSINKLLKDQIKEQYSDQIADIVERVKNDPDNAGLSGREKRKLINAEVNKFVTSLWNNAGGDEKVIAYKLTEDTAKKIKNVATGGKAHESTYRLYNDLRNIAKNNQHRTIREQLFLDAFDMAETRKDNEENVAWLKGEVKDARNNLTNINAELREHERAVDKARSNFYKDGDSDVKVTHKNGWTFFDRGKAHYAAQVEYRDGKKKYVIYSATEGSPDTQRDPIWEFDYQDYKGENNPNEIDAKIRISGDDGQVEGGFENAKAAAKEAQDKQDFETLDGQNYFDYRKKHKVIATKVLKLIIDRGGKVDRETGKIYSVSKDDFPEGADELYLDYSTAYKLAKGNDEEVAKLTGMSLNHVKDFRISGMDRPYSIGDAHVVVDDKGRVVYQLPDNNMSVYSGKYGSFYINWNNPENRKVVEKYAKMGMTKQDIPLSELKTVNTSRSTEGNIDWSDTKKTKAAEETQKAQYTGAYKPSTSVLDALIGFGRKYNNEK